MSDEFLDLIEEQMTQLEFDTPEFRDEPEREGDKDYGTDLYKKWSKAGGTGRVLSIRPWLEAGKISIDIGETVEAGGKARMKGHTLVWTNILGLATYLSAVRDGRGAQLYPANAKAGVPTPEGFVYYGGGKIEGKPVSRILKIHHWQSGDNNFDDAAFVWKCGHFSARTSSTGAYIPDMSKVLSINSIKVTRTEMAEIAYSVNLALINHASRTETKTWLKELTGKNR